MMHDPAPDDPKAFAKYLRAQPVAHLPKSWRAEILAAALPVVPRPSTRRQPRAITVFLRAWLWPHPLAYAALLTVWGAILALRLSTPAMEATLASPRMAAQPNIPHDDLPILRRVYLASRQSDALSDQEGRP